MMKQKHKQSGWKHLGQSAVGLALAAVAVLGLAGLMTPKAEAGMEYYLDKVVEWGVMRGDINGNLNPNREITRAEFVTLVNRAYGYKEVGPNPFTDINSKDWFYEDVCIGNKVGYFKGTTPTTASPRSKLTREQAAVIIGRNMMLEQGTGEALGFSDSRKFGDWSRHMIQAVSEQGIITGYADGSFRPKNNVTRGQVAAMLVRAVGTPVQHPGEQSLGGVYGNVTITSPGVTLKDTTIYGDLYVSGGVGLGNVVLENVKVMGKIVVSGTGESEKGEHSVVLRNVSADELVMDSLAQQFVTLKSEGLTNIEKVNVRTGAYLEDLTEEAYGLKSITLDGVDGAKFQLAGNIKDVTMKTTNGELTLAQGIANSITVDESAKNTTLNIANKATSNEVNLDAATTVTGTGDVGHMNVNAPGSKTDMLPDTIVVRPGISADIKGEVMDSVAAEESSEDPRLLSGYPLVKNISPKDAEAVFKTNKKGTIYWAVTSLMDGSVSEAELLDPPAYSAKILSSGTIKADASNKDFLQKITKLTSDGSYYVSAMLVDNRDMHSPVKVAAFTTPDDTVPNFASGYPYAIMTVDAEGEQVVQAMVMPTKNCLMYYALLPKGSVAPKPADFKANSVTGNLGYNVVDVKKNTPHLIPQVNQATLEEETEYDLYLWLTDANGVKSSAVKKLTVKTLDKTPPQIIHLDATEIKPTAVSLTFALDEPGTLYWAVVNRGENFYADPSEDFKDSNAGKAQIESGIGATKRGQVSASKGNTDVKFTVSGLKPQTAYDLYYVAKDKAGNYCIYKKNIKLPYPIHTEDAEGPTVTQEFIPNVADEKHPEPIPETTVNLVFSEDVRGVISPDGRPVYQMFKEKYDQKPQSSAELKQWEVEWADMLREHLELYEGDNQRVKERKTGEETDWTIDYRNVRMEPDRSGSGGMIMVFPYIAQSNGQVSDRSALNLSGGVTYQFKVKYVEDMSGNPIQNVDKYGAYALPKFTTVSANVVFSKTYADVPGDKDWKFDLTVKANPLANKNMPNETVWDLLIWSDTQITFKVYMQEKSSDGKWGAWDAVGGEYTINTDGPIMGLSLRREMASSPEKAVYTPVNAMNERNYSIQITSVNSDPNRANWNKPVHMGFTAVIGREKSAMIDLGSHLGSMDYDAAMKDIVRNGQLQDISSPVPCMLEIPFTDDSAPKFIKEYPKFEVGESTIQMDVSLDRPNASYTYVLVPEGQRFIPAVKQGDEMVKKTWDELPQDGSDPSQLLQVDSPKVGDIISYNAQTGKGEKKGKEYCYGSNTVSSITLEGLKPKTKYVAFFVLQGQSQKSQSDKVYCFRFETGDVATPIITLNNKGSAVGVRTSTDAELNWVLMASNMVNMNTTYSTGFADMVGYNSHDKKKLEVPGTTKESITAEKKKTFEANWSKYFSNFAHIKDSGDIRVIDAMVASVGGSGSVFDIYAGESIYELTKDEVLSPSDKTYVTDLGGPVKTQKNTPLRPDIQPQGMKGITQYYFISVARNSLGEIYGFSAVPNVHKMIDDPPEVAGQPETTLLTANKVGTDGGVGEKVNIPSTIEKPMDYYYSGEVTINFTKVPYRIVTIDGETVTQKLVNPSQTPLKPGEVSVMDCIKGSGVSIDEVSIDNQAITIKFSQANVGNGAFIRIFNGGWIGDLYGNAHENASLKLEFKGPMFNTVPKPSDKPVDTTKLLPRFEAIWSDGHAIIT